MNLTMENEFGDGKQPMRYFYCKDKLEAGIDEAGRGPMFGRLYVGAVILYQDDEFYDHSLMKDSKKLSARKRLVAYDYIREHALDWNVAWCDEKHIDEVNILQATYDTMHRAIDGLKLKPDHLLVDGDRFRYYYRGGKCIPHTCLENGDNLYTPVAAASIVAKVEHDKYIEEMCDEHPELDEFYGLRSNKGYGTAQHLEGIKKYGSSEWHRKTFGICKDY